jgi:hypothetical protein
MFERASPRDAAKLYMHYGETVKAGFGLTDRLLTVQLPLSGCALALSVLVALLQLPLIVEGPQFAPSTLKPTFATLPAVVLVATSFHGSPMICGTPHKPLPVIATELIWA